MLGQHLPHPRVCSILRAAGLQARTPTLVYLREADATRTPAPRTAAPTANFLPLLHHRLPLPLRVLLSLQSARHDLRHLRYARSKLGICKQQLQPADVLGHSFDIAPAVNGSQKHVFVFSNCRHDSCSMNWTDELLMNLAVLQGSQQTERHHRLAHAVR